MLGRTLLHYDIVDKLGEGGMGVVYKARDTRLQRFVAIKILPKEAGESPERKRRFVQEARAASALNHPNILHVYDIDTVDGVDFIAMEYVDGKTLAETLDRKKLPVRETLRYATQMADALAAAHSAGIIHRDIKPSNIMVTEKSLVKVLDFGLAKLTQTDGLGESTETQTIRPRTEEGTIVGTVAYMSPEQAEGKQIDSRSDIFSFGSVLYEMATGIRPFQGQNRISTLSAILNSDPVPPGRITATLPRELERIITHCLRKDAGRRFQHMDDVKTLLEELKEEFESGRLAPVPIGETQTIRRRWLLPAIIAVVLLAMTVGIVSLFRRPLPAPLLSDVTRLTYDAGLTTDPDLSRDGRLLAYASDRASPSAGEGNLDIWVQQIAGGEPIQLTHDPADDHEPAFSPDSSQIAFRSERNGGGVYVIPTLGGEERLIASEGRRPRFSPDGQWILYWTGNPITSLRVNGGRVFAVRATGGTPTPIAANLGKTCFPVWSADGRRVLLRSAEPFSEPKWWVVPIGGGTVVETANGAFFRAHKLSNPTPIAWVRDPDRIVFASGPDFAPLSSLWEAAISPRTWKLDGIPHRLTLGTGVETAASVATLGNGTLQLAFSSRAMIESIWALPIDTARGSAAGDAVRLTSGTSDGQPHFAANGGMLFFNSFLSVNPRNWVEDMASGKRTSLTTTQYERHPAPAGDGSRVAYQARDPATSKLAVFSLDVKWNTGATAQPGVPRRISRFDSEQCGWPWSWSSNGKRLLYNCPVAGPVRLYDSESGETRQVLGEGILDVRYSPDDRWIAFQRITREGAQELFVAAFIGGVAPPENEWISVAAEGKNADWAADGNLLYFLSFRDGFSCIWAQRLDPSSKKPVGAPFSVYHSHNSRRSLSNVTGFDQEISLAGRRIAFVLGEQTGNIWTARWNQK